MGRNEVMSRSTRVQRTEERERTYWRWGHLYAVRDEDVDGNEVVRLGVGSPHTNHASETPDLLINNGNVAADLLRAAVVDAGGSACGGDSIIEMLWKELDAVVDRLMGAGQQSGDGKDPGRAEGIAFAIAVMQNPYLPSVDAVREQAMDRWENGE
jgi:hypothetical protein